MKIYAPVKDFNGLRSNVMFVNGVGETDNPQLIGWFKSKGYTLSDEKCDNSLRIEQEKCDKANENSLKKGEPDFDSMTPNDLREWMRENGYGSKIKNTRNKEKLLEILRG